MDREILFRGKRIDNGEWAVGFYSPLIWYPSLEQTPRIKTFKGGDIEINLETLGQYTGIKDKNGTRVFEGDIVLTDGLINTKVVWDTDRLMWSLEYPKGEKVALYSFEKWDIEVVGNVYDDSELLEG